MVLAAIGTPLADCLLCLFICFNPHPAQRLGARRSWETIHFSDLVRAGKMEAVCYCGDSGWSPGRGGLRTVPATNPDPQEDEMNEWTVEVTEQDFESAVVERSYSVPVVVDFWAPWCGPCRAISPVLEQLVRASGGTVTLAKVNVDEQPALAARYGIHSIPTLLFVKDGRVLDQVVGAVPKADLQGRLDALR